MARTKPAIAEEHAYTVVFEPEAEGGYTVTCPALPGLVTYGATIDEARAMAAEAIACYLESLRKDGLPVPEGDDAGEPVAGRVRVQLRPA